ncbi:MAG: hypothetical protein HY017_18155 [Betaproteobacteria bacterium]|nr:hypothetical protein [Betaproteobacteria bacterium]
MAQWCLGMMDCAEEKPALMRGRSLFDGAEAWVRVDSDPAKFSAEYWCGAAPDALTPRIHARVIPGPSLGYGAHECLATLLAWRPAAMSDERWRRLMVTHETEILLIREQLTREIATIDPTKQE